jgi:hypothetical protein
MRLPHYPGQNKPAMQIVGMRFFVVTYWVLGTMLCALGSIIVYNMGYKISSTNLLWLGMAMIILFSGEIFSRAVSSSIADEPDKIVLFVSQFIAMSIITVAEIANLINLFGGKAIKADVPENLLWSMIMAGTFVGVVIPLVRYYDDLTSEIMKKRYISRDMQIKQQHEDWLNEVSMKFDEWDRQYEAGTLPESYEDLK